MYVPGSCKNLPLILDPQRVLCSVTVGFPVGLYSLSSVRETVCNHPRDRSQGVFPLISNRFDVSYISFQLLSTSLCREHCSFPQNTDVRLALPGERGFLRIDYLLFKWKWFLEAPNVPEESCS